MGLGIEVVHPNKPLANKVIAFTTTRSGGVSSGVYSSFNLATHVGDDLARVMQNRNLLQNYLASLSVKSPQVGGSIEPIAWLDQQHTNKVVYAENSEQLSLADAIWTDKVNLPIAVLTADCLPILLTNRSGTLVAAIHAGWRGLAQGIIQNTVNSLPEKPENLIAWIGPAITQEFFQVGSEVKEEFIQQNPSWDKYFQKDLASKESAKYLADLPSIAEDILLSLQALKASAGLGELPLERGVKVEKSNLCTFSDKRFFSYRKSGETGRIASVIMLQK